VSRISREELAFALRVDAGALAELAAQYRLPFISDCGEFFVESADVGVWSRALTWRRNLKG
jgi:hypothetical protein